MILILKIPTKTDGKWNEGGKSFNPKSFSEKKIFLFLNNKQDYSRNVYILCINQELKQLFIPGPMVPMKAWKNLTRICLKLKCILGKGSRIKKM